MSYLKIKIDDKFSKPLARKLARAGSKAAHAVAVQIQSDTEPFVPFLTGSQVERTQTIGNRIIYPGPYARYLYYGKVMVFKDPPYLRTLDNGKIVLSHKGQKKEAINKPLDIKKRSGHKQATDHWLEASKAQNLDKWIRKAGEAIEDELK